ncbi:hypothetical protein ACJX0J_008027, partial [Zea mays]
KQKIVKTYEDQGGAVDYLIKSTRKKKHESAKIQDEVQQGSISQTGVWPRVCYYNKNISAVRVG